MISEGINVRSERDRLNARAGAISQFLDKRVVWSPILGEISGVIPEGTRLTDVRGSAVMTKKRKRAVKSIPTTLILDAECTLNEDGQLPSSVSQLTETISNLQSVGKHFDRIELSDLRRTDSAESNTQGAKFSIMLTTNSKGNP